MGHGYRTLPDAVLFVGLLEVPACQAADALPLALSSGQIMAAGVKSAWHLSVLLYSSSRLVSSVTDGGKVHLVCHCRQKTSVKQNGVQRFFAACPENAFQKVQGGQAPFTVAQRFGAVARNGTKLLVVGFSASMIGVTITNALTGVRQMLDPAFVPLNPPQVYPRPKQNW